jgi:hypothetical protein
MRLEFQRRSARQHRHWQRWWDGGRQLGRPRRIFERRIFERRLPRRRLLRRRIFERRIFERAWIALGSLGSCSLDVRGVADGEV